MIWITERDAKAGSLKNLHNVPKLEPFRTVSELVTSYFKAGSNGYQINFLVQMHAAIFLNEKPAPLCLSFKLRDPREVLRMLDPGVPAAIPTEETLNFCSVYPPSDDFPLAICYYWPARTVDDLLVMAKLTEGDGFPFKIPTPEEFEALVKVENRDERCRQFLAQKARLMAPFGELLNGRLDAGTVNNAIHLQTDGCMVCHKPGDPVFTTLGGEKGLVFAMEFCPAHKAEAKESSCYLDYVFGLLKHGGLIDSEPVSLRVLHEEAIRWAAEELDCDILHGKAVTLVRKQTKCRIIVRFNSPLDYAYVLLDSHGKQLSRIDSADHHRDRLTVGPDHIHHVPGHDNKDVSASFTYGILQRDLPMIRRMLAEHGG